MAWSRRQSVWTVTVAGVMLAAVFVFDAFGARSAFSRPTTIATIEIERVLNQLDQRTEAEAELARKADVLEQERSSRAAEIEALKQRRLDESDRARRLELDSQIALQSRELADWVQFKRAELDLEKALLIEGLYRAVRAAAGETAQAQGYDIVMVDDSAREFQVVPEARVTRESQVRTQLLSRRLLYAGDIVDATDDLIVRMNNAHGSGRQ